MKAARMALKYRVLPAHRRKIRRLREFVTKASADAPDLPMALEYLETHASCEAYMTADFNGPEPSERPRCGVARSAVKGQAKSSASKERRRAARKALRRDSDEAFIQETRQALGLKSSLALDRSRSSKNGGHEVSGGLPGLGKRN